MNNKELRMCACAYVDTRMCVCGYAHVRVWIRVCAYKVHMLWTLISERYCILLLFEIN